MVFSEGSEATKRYQEAQIGSKGIFIMVQNGTKKVQKSTKMYKNIQKGTKKGTKRLSAFFLVSQQTIILQQCVLLRKKTRRSQEEKRHRRSFAFPSSPQGMRRKTSVSKSTHVMSHAYFS